MVLFPPRVWLMLGDLIDTYGFVNEMNTNGKAPWSLAKGLPGLGGSAGALPTVCTFSGQFTAAPLYKEGIAQILDTTDVLSAQTILRRGYRVSRF